MSHGEGEDALVLEAREMLAAGQSDAEVFAELAASTGKWGVCLLAVCLALGVPRTDAEARLREVEPFFSDFAVGEEEHSGSGRAPSSRPGQHVSAYRSAQDPSRVVVRVRHPLGGSDRGRDVRLSCPGAWIRRPETQPPAVL